MENLSIIDHRLCKLPDPSISDEILKTDWVSSSSTLKESHSYEASLGDNFLLKKFSFSDNPLFVRNSIEKPTHVFIDKLIPTDIRVMSDDSFIPT